jgi:hypothetical protein
MAIVEVLLARVIGDIAANGLHLIFGSSETDERIELWTVALKDSSGSIIGILDNTQVDDVARFLDSAEVRSLMQAHFLCRIASEDKYTTKEIHRDIRIAFENLAGRWCANEQPTWSSLSGDIWDGLESYLTAALPADRLLKSLTPEEAKNFREHMGSDPSSTKARRGVPRFLRELVDMSLNMDRLLAIRDNVIDIRRQTSEYYAQMRLEHAQHDYRIQIDELYIDRDLKEHGSDGTISCSEILVRNHSSRLVVTGDPGVGKSTFTEYLIQQLAEDDDEDWMAPLVIHCREYVTSASGIVPALKEKMSSTLHLRMSEQDIEDILTLGRGFIIVDGIDEILDIGRRRALIRAVESLARRFPLCSIIATSRNIGYTQAQFEPTKFRRYELHSFTEDQIEEYAQRWFQFTGRPESDLTKFLSDLESIPDLRGNPLILSLLCVLYRARGHIPRNRRQIYSQCADLLFNRWDPMRQIEQPFDHQHYGDELMQEIAIWFYRSQAAQAGLEEQQIRKVISMFLRDTAAVPDSAADKRAGVFLDFCADRAWLLGKAGTNDRGQRLFVFTHRTFMEFFAAEWLVRNSELETVLDEVASIYDRDASSVLPDLIVQCAEVHRRGGARQIISGLLERGRTRGKRNAEKYLPLCLRIVNLSPVNPRVMDDIFDRTLAEWGRNAPSDTAESFWAVLDLYSDPRARFVDRLMADAQCIRERVCQESHSHSLLDFVRRWAHAWMSGWTSDYELEWKEPVDAFIRSLYPPVIESIDSPTTRHYLVENGYITPQFKIPDDLVVLAFGLPVAGCAFRSIERIILDGPRGYDGTVINDLAIFASKPIKVSQKFAIGLDRVAQISASHFPYSWEGVSADSSHIAGLRKILLWVGCALFEAMGAMNSFHDISEVVVGLKFKRLFDSREHYLDQKSYRYEEDQEEDLGKRLNPLSVRAIERLPHSHPAWIKGWCTGDTNLLIQPDRNLH